LSKPSSISRHLKTCIPRAQTLQRIIVCAQLAGDGSLAVTCAADECARLLLGAVQWRAEDMLSESLLTYAVHAVEKSRTEPRLLLVLDFITVVSVSCYRTEAEGQENSAVKNFWYGRSALCYWLSTGKVFGSLIRNAIVVSATGYRSFFFAAIFRSFVHNSLKASVIFSFSDILLWLEKGIMTKLTIFSTRPPPDACNPFYLVSVYRNVTFCFAALVLY